MRGIVTRAGNGYGAISGSPSKSSSSARKRSAAVDSLNKGPIKKAEIDEASKETKQKTTTGLADCPEVVLAHSLLNYLNLTELAKMMNVSLSYNQIIKQHHSLYGKLQHQKYLRFAQQAADQIEDADLYYEAYVAIATEQAKSDSEAAKKTAAEIKDNYQKYKAYVAIATEQAKSDPEAAKKTAAEIKDNDQKYEAYVAIATEQAKSDSEAAKKTAAQIEDADKKANAYVAIVTEQAKSDPEAAQKTTALIQNVVYKPSAYIAIATEQAKLDHEAANKTFKIAKKAADQIEEDDFYEAKYKAYVAKLRLRLNRQSQILK